MTARYAVVTGSAIGIGVTAPALLAAILSGGAGHGHYTIARALFPVPMLLTLVDGQIGFLAGGAALVELPLYGTLLGWSMARRSLVAPLLLLAVHAAAVALCFGGMIPNFS